MVCPNQKKRKVKETEGNAETDKEKVEEFRELYDKCYRDVEKLNSHITF
jgi:H/ACA ribonucleoprotein complex subunit 2